MGGGWDYFEYMLPDCLANLDKVDADAVAQFFSETSGPAKEFYESDKDMRWKTKVRPFLNLFPFEKTATFLKLIAKVRKNPASRVLTDWLEKERGWHLLLPENKSDLIHVGAYSAFMLTLTQKGEEQTAYLNRLDLSKLAQNYRGQPPWSSSRPPKF